MTVDIRISQDLLNMDKNMKKGLVNALDKMGNLVARRAKNTKSFIDRSGILRAKIIREPVDKKNLLVIVSNYVEYAKYVHDGTRYIRARRYLDNALEQESSKFEGIIVSELDKTM